MKPEEAIEVLTSPDTHFGTYKCNGEEWKKLKPAIELAVSALKKQIPEKPQHVHIKHGKHSWRKNENGEVDDFAFEYGNHNGVVCDVCGECVCVCCNPNYDEAEDCEDEYWLCPDCGERIGYKSKICDCGKYIDWEKK